MRPLYAKVAVSLTGIRDRRVGAATSSTSTTPGVEERFSSMESRGTTSNSAAVTNAVVSPRMQRASRPRSEKRKRERQVKRAGGQVE